LCLIRGRPERREPLGTSCNRMGSIDLQRHASGWGLRDWHMPGLRLRGPPRRLRSSRALVGPPSRANARGRNGAGSGWPRTLALHVAQIPNLTNQMLYMLCAARGFLARIRCRPYTAFRRRDSLSIESDAPNERGTSGKQRARSSVDRASDFGLPGRMPYAPRGEWACKTSRIKCSK